MSNTNILVRTIAIIAIIELIIMQTFSLVDIELSSLEETILDAFLLSFLSAPLIYKFVIHKFVEESTFTSNRLKKLNETFSENVIASSSDLKGKIVYTSKALCKISGYSEEELLGMPHSRLRHPDMPSSIFENLWKTIKSGKEWRGEIKNKTKDGGYYWTRSIIVPELDKNGNIIGYGSVRQDITNEKAKEEFMSNMSHELRTPLNSIIGFSNILSKKLSRNDLTICKQINNSSKSLLGLINDILDLSKIQDSSFSVEAFEFNAYPELVEFSNQFSGLTASKSLTFETHITKHLEGTFFGDFTRIKQICLNLTSNAIKFTPENGKIIFSVDYKDEHIIINVTDNGIGMNKEVQEKVFKPFTQADGTTTRKYGGTGLGLSITQKLVELMEGHIELISSEGKGSTFIVSLPLKKINNVSINEKKLPTEAQDKENTLEGHILIVEDNKTNQMLIKMLIEDFGLTCDIANDGLEAIDLYDPTKHKLILMDENMPNMNGLEAMNILRKRYAKQCGKIIALTANAMEGDKEKFIKLGMDGYISKPIDEDFLYNILKGSLT